MGWQTTTPSITDGKDRFSNINMQEVKTLDLKGTGIEPLNKLETFILIEGTKHYYISSEGRLANDIRGKAYLHKNTAHGNGRVHWKVRYEGKNGALREKDEFADNLVAQAFLEKVRGKKRVYHIDGNNSNSRYSNLVYVSQSELNALRKGDISVGDLGRAQEYVPFLNSSRMKAKRLWNDMYSRCYNEKFHERQTQYKGCCICDYWMEDRERFYAWVEENYYTVGNEPMDLDKDILFKGNKVYSPETCVFVPHAINTLFLDCKKVRGKCPVGVHYDKGKGKYRASLNVGGRNIKLGTFDTPDEAFVEYKKHKEALIIVMADRYKGKIPGKVYRAMVNWEINIDD